MFTAGVSPALGASALRPHLPWSSFATQHGDNGVASQDGTFELNGLFPGEYSVTAAALRPSEQWTGRFFAFGNARVQVLDRDTETEVSVGPLADLSGIGC